MPLVTMASAVSRINDSLTRPWNLFQLFQPICGVRASCSNFWPGALKQQAAQEINSKTFFMVVSRVLFREGYDNDPPKAMSIGPGVNWSGRAEGSPAIGPALPPTPRIK